MIAVGHQHPYMSFSQAASITIREQGFLALWRGATASCARASIGSGFQLPAFSIVQRLLDKYQVSDYLVISEQGQEQERFLTSS